MKSDQQSPPKFLIGFFRWFCHPKLRDHIEGDLMELYHERVKSEGKRKADIKFAWDVVFLMRPSIIKPSPQNINSFIMYRSYFTIGWRNLYKNKAYSAINIGGLALGMSVAILIGLWIHDELSFNKYHRNYDRIGQVYHTKLWNNEVFANNYLTTGMGTLLNNEYGNYFEKVAIFRARSEDHVLAVGENKFTQQGYFSQASGPEIFSLNMIEGSQGDLKEMKSIFLSASLAQKLFPGQSALNEVISFDAKWDLRVAGVYEDLPKNSTFNDASYFATLDLWLDGWSSLDIWDNYNVYVYVQLRDEARFDDASKAIKGSFLPHIPADARGANQQPFLLPMKDWHLNAQFENGVQITSAQMNTVWYYGLIGGFVLILACINFMNLTTARSERRAKEVGIRKAIGSLRSQLIRQFYSESLLIAGLAFVISILLVQVALPGFNSISDKDVSLPWIAPGFLVSSSLFILLTGLLAGSYPALYLSSFNPIKVLKGTFKAGRYASLPRKALVTLQFTISMAIIVGTAVVYQQIQFGKNRPVGYTREGLISLHPMSPDFRGTYDVLRAEMKKTGLVEEIAEADYPVTSTLGWNDGFDWPGKDKNSDDPSFNINAVTYEYGKTLGWEFTEGRDFAREFPSDESGVVINESTKELLALSDPVGQTLTRNQNGTIRNFTILGVIRDVVKGSPFEKTDACLYFLSQRTMSWLYIRLDPSVPAHEALPKIGQVFTQVVPSAPFDYTFADDNYDSKFKGEVKIGTMATVFSTFAIIISCLGLFGLASFVAEQRTKEIGIRKVMGASVFNVWSMLSRDFVLLVALSAIIALPLSNALMSRWLERYTYHTTLSWHIFAITAGGILLITLLTVSYQAIVAATSNPVRSLRSE